MTSPRRAVEDLRALADEHAHAEHGVLLDDHALDDFGARADEAVVLDDRGIGLHRLEHAADAHASRQVDVLADLRAGADRRPGVDHRALVDVRADVHERRHEHDVLREEGAAPRDGGRDDPDAGRRKLIVGKAGELGRHLVVERERLGAPGAPLEAHRRRCRQGGTKAAPLS